MGKKPRTTDAAFEYVAGPMRPGDEHPRHPGWFFVGTRGRRGEWLWYKPPGLISRWIRRIAAWLYVLMIGSAMIAAMLFDN